MPDVPRAELIWNPGYAPVLVDHEDTTIGVRHYKVNTGDESNVFRAAGLPRRFDRWDASHPGLLCVTRATERIGGTDDTTTATGAWTRVRCEYDLRASQRPYPIPNGKFTQIFSRISSVTQILDVRKPTDGTPSAFDRPIENGKGAQREIGGAIVKVTTFPTDVSNGLLGRMMDYQARQVVNDAPLTFPKIVGLNTSFSAARGTCRYVDLEVGVEYDLLKIVQTFQLAPNASSYYWWTVGTDGLPVTRVEAWLYQQESFVGLW